MQIMQAELLKLQTETKLAIAQETYWRAKHLEESIMRRRECPGLPDSLPLPKSVTVDHPILHRKPSEMFPSEAAERVDTGMLIYSWNFKINAYFRYR